MTEHRVPSVPGAYGGSVSGHSGPPKGGDPDPKLGGDLVPLVDRAMLPQDLIDRVGTAVMIYTVDATGYGELTRTTHGPTEADMCEWLRTMATALEAGTVKVIYEPGKD